MAMASPTLAFTTSAPVPTVLVALRKGDGTFSAPVSYPSNGNQSIAIGDVNGDGIPDVVTSGISILFGDGTGGFPTRRDYVQPTAGEIVLIDFDGDGIRDIVTGVGASWILSGTAVAVLYGRRDGTFSGAPISLVPGSDVGGNPAIAIESADLDGDGIPDLLYTDLQTGITALLGNGDGTFKAVWQFMPKGFANSLAIGDFNRDGIPDFAAGIDSPVAGVIEVFLGVGDGTFQPPTFIQAGSSLSDQSNLVAADFNGDGKIDLALAWTPYYTSGTNVTSSVLIFLGTGDGTFGSPMTAMTAPGFFTITTGDFNKDGAPDIAVASDGSLSQTPSGVTILLGKGDGTFTGGATVPLTSVGYSLVAADFNGDGKLDLAVKTGGFAVLLGIGNGTFQKPVLYFLNSSNLREADVNGDGIPDLVSGTIYGEAVGFGYLLGNGDGSFQPEVQLGPPFGPIVAADLNGDGQVDIASGGAAIGVAAMLNISRLGTLPPRRRRAPR
jgi:FG-GAP-like repeat